jgi:shikimate kinase
MKERKSEARAVFLVGFMGAGKTSVGHALSARLDWPFQDLDDLIQSREGRSIQEIFSQSGEAEFRRLEHVALRELIAELKVAPRIIGLGGGAFVQPANFNLVQESGITTVFLDASVQELWQRCSDQSVARPLQRDHGEFRALYESRRPQYLKAAVHIDTAGRTVNDVAIELTLRLGWQGRMDPKES